ncbi:MAG: DEAD/DEAH box helicase family protein [Phaeodactylibacter sp.]|nr:DEAD/DEAH box helicase family protein [Phaeodactylibacter sp.]MCB9054136.1 DEAD/DEAH box helicase family protein [Lewinellaceae bacterium]
MAKRKNSEKEKKKKAKRISYHKQPEELSLREWQASLRRQFGKEQAFELTNQGGHPVWSDFTVSNPERNTTYRLALRSKEPGDNFCSCLDFRTNGLGTCKHIEWALHKLSHTYGNKQHFKKPPPERAYSSVYLHYGEERTLRLRIGTDQEEAFRELARGYFDEEGALYPHAYLEIDKFLDAARQLSPDFRCYPDALDFVIQKRDDARRHLLVDRLDNDPHSLNELIKAQLFPYQREGVLFALRAGCCLLADEMGLGKTIQAIATAELYRRELGIGSVMIICPTSLKYQWRSEIRKFTDSGVSVIEGPIHKRREQYNQDENFYKIITYNVVARDYAYINQGQPDLIILDEAQRIKNWDTKISRAVKRLEAPYRLALTGTPLENKLEDLYSIVQFLDQYLLGPLYLLLHRHQVKDEFGAVRGYRRLDEINDKLKHVMIRRRKRDVLKQLPERIDKHLLVPMTPRQLELHNSFETDVAQLVAKWRRFGFLKEKDRQRLLSCLNLMRMSCDSTYLVDQQTRHDTKISELFYILEERLAEPEEKVVIFSQWERMTRIVSQELEEREVQFAYLHGGVPSNKRGDLLDRFREDDNCRVFLSTDAGGLGLNLQQAALVINLDIPWNPAVLEQRIARIFRLGQKRQVQVINLISEGTIEHRMLSTLRFKSSLADAVLDAIEDSVFMSDRKFRDFMEDLEKVATPSEPSAAPVEVGSDTDLEVPQGAPPSAPEEEAPVPAEDWQEEDPAPKKEPAAPSPRQPKGEPLGATAGGSGPRELISQGVSFLGRLAQTLADEQATRQLVDEITEKDESTGQTYLKIPVESEDVVKNAMKLLGGLLGKL